MSQANTEITKRPISVWLMQILFIIFISLFGLSLSNIIRDSNTSHSPSTELGKILFVIATIGALMVALSWALVAIFQRKYWSKWIGASMLLVVLSFVFAA